MEPLGDDYEDDDNDNDYDEGNWQYERAVYPVRSLCSYRAQCYSVM